MLVDLIDFLISTAPVANLVKTDASVRIYPVVRPQASLLPAVTVQRISGAPVGSDEGDSELSVARVQVDIWGASWLETHEMANAIRAALSGLAFTHGGTEFESVTTEDESDTTEPGTGSAVIFRTRFDFQIWHKGA